MKFWIDINISDCSVGFGACCCRVCDCMWFCIAIARLGGSDVVLVVWLVVAVILGS